MKIKCFCLLSRPREQHPAQIRDTEHTNKQFPRPVEGQLDAERQEERVEQEGQAVFELLW